MNITELDSYNLADAVKFHDRLNPRLWGRDERLLPEVRSKLLAVAADFQEFLGVPDLDVEDITISGSNAAYNYTPESDIDLHLVVRMPAENSEVFQELFNAKKYQYNDEHDIRIGGADVELYVQPQDQPHHSQGIYSVQNDQWLQVPRRKKVDINDTCVIHKTEDLESRIDSAVASGDETRMTRLWDKIKAMRQTGLEQQGEFGCDNLVFKMLRRSGHIQRLKTARNQAHDHALSLAEKVRPQTRLRYGFRTEDAGETWDGVNPTTTMIVSEEQHSEKTVHEFIDWAAGRLGIKKMPEIFIHTDPEWSVQEHSFGRYEPDTHSLHVNMANRHLFDILRTTAHELVHCKQNERRPLPPHAGKTGSRYENQAHALAGVIMRDFADAHPELFASAPLSEGRLSRAVAAGAIALAASLSHAQDYRQQPSPIMGALNAALKVYGLSRVTAPGVREELAQEVKNYVRAQNGDANAQNQSWAWQYQQQQQTQVPQPSWTQPEEPVRESASGYIPKNRREAQDPRFSMAITGDIKPGQVGKEANKLALHTGRNGEPGLLMKTANLIKESVNDYLWHGSRNKHDVLYPQQADDTGGAEQSNKNAVYATPSARVAIAMGLTTPGSDTGMFPNDPQMVLFKGAIRRGQMVYLHKVPKDLFIKHNSREWYSKPGVTEVKPIETKAIPVDQWLQLIRTATPQDWELRKKYTKKQDVAEAFDQPYALTWEQGDFGDWSASAKLPDGNYIEILFTRTDRVHQYWYVEFYRNHSQDVTGEGDAMRVFATVMQAIGKFVKKIKPPMVKLAATKDVDPGIKPESRARLYQRMAQRFAADMGYQVQVQDRGIQVNFEFTRQTPVAEGYQDDSKEREENLRYSRSRNPVADAIRKKLNPNQKEQNKEQGVAEGKIKLSTDPNWYGAEVGDYRASGPVVNIPANRLVGFEPDDKMNQPASKANVEKIVAGLKQGAKLPPLLVRQYKNGYQVLDGHHRFWAYKLLGVKSIPAQVVPAKDIEEIGKQGVAEGFSNDMSTEDMIAYLRQHHDKNLHPDYLNHLTSTNSKFVLKNIPINSIKTELSGLDRSKVEQYKKMDFSKAPPIVVGSDGNILDGYHRATVAKALGIPTIKAYVGVKGQPGVAEDDLAESLRREFELLESQYISEISMRPTNLRQEAARTGAIAGMEFEMIVPNVANPDADVDSEPDFDMNESVNGIEDACQFFYDGDVNSRRDIANLREEMNQQYEEWYDDQQRVRWEEESSDYIRDWLWRTYEDDWREEARSELGDEASDEQIEEFVTEKWASTTDDVMANMGSDWDAAYEEWSEDFRANNDLEDEWLRDQGWDTMLDIRDNFDIQWPHYYTPESDGADISSVADDFSDAVGMPINAASNYHSGRREPGKYVVEPDGSLEPDDSDDMGLEFVSPPMPIDELLDQLKKVRAWAGRYGCYTNESTGLHINISVPNYDLAKLDYVKLALLMGDEYVLDQFDRSSNTYCKSAMSKIRDILRTNPDAAKQVLDKMKGHMDDLATKAIHSGVTQKYTSINTKDGYIEFRSPGGDWLDANFDKIENTLLRFTVALSAAMDPAAYREEYLKKLYKLLSPKGEDDPIAYFARYSAGQLPKSALSSFVRQVQLQRKIKRGQTGDKPMWWNVSWGNGRVEVVAKSQQEAIDTAFQESYWAPDQPNTPEAQRFRASLRATPIRPYDQSPVQARVGEPQAIGQRSGPTLGGRPSNPDGNYVIFAANSRAGDPPAYRFMAADIDDADTVLLQWSREHPAGHWEVHYDPSQSLGQPPVPGSTIDLQRQRSDPYRSVPIPGVTDVELDIARAEPRPFSVGRELLGWSVLLPSGQEVTQIRGIGNNQGDANRIAADWLRRNGYGVSGEGYSVVPLWGEA